MYAPTTAPTPYREMDAKYASNCGECPYGIRPGERIATKGAGWAHVDCEVTVSKREPAKPLAPAPTPVTITGLDGCYATENPDGRVTFLKIDAPAKDRWAGWVFVKEQHGPNFDRVGLQSPGHPYHGTKLDLITAIMADPETAMRRYGTELGHCGKCGLELTDAESRSFGVGPVCRKALGW